MNPHHNRAVSAFYRVFGDKERIPAADDQELTQHGGINRQETLTLAILIPLTVLVAIHDQLAESMGSVAGFLLAIPATFVVLQFLPFLLCAKSPTLQWQLWFSICLVWAIYRCTAVGIVGIFAWTWLAIGIFTLVAVLVIGWRASMLWSGKLGVLWRLLILLVPHLGVIALGIRFGLPWAILGGGVVAAIFCWAVLKPGAQILGPVVCETHTRDILITIDDGPCPENTPHLLDLLDRYHTKAIFFMIGDKVRAHPELAQEVIRRGHEIGNHTLSHPQASFWCAGPWRTRREISQCQKTIQEATGVIPRWFRAPVGHRNLFTHPIAKAHGLQVMAWTRRGFDAVEKDSAKVLAKILPQLSKGDIVLLHEGTAIAEELLEAVLARKQTLLNPTGYIGKPSIPKLSAQADC